MVDKNHGFLITYRVKSSKSTINPLDSFVKIIFIWKMLVLNLYVGVGIFDIFTVKSQIFHCLHNFYFSR